MKIIIPPHKKLSLPVQSWREIKQDALAMIARIEQGNFPDGRYREAFALSHSQVSVDPRCFFVVNWKQAEVKKQFRYNIIINPVILKKEDERVLKDACMSEPFKKPANKKRYALISVVYQTPGWFGRLKKIRQTFYGTAAFIFQHEEEHFNGVY